MRAERVLSLSGPNVWSHEPVLEAWIKTDDTSGIHAPGVATIHERMAREMSTLTKTADARPVQVLQDLWLALLRHVGEPTERSWVHGADSNGLARCVVESGDELIARRCLDIALRWYVTAAREETLPLTKLLTDLRDFAADRRLGRITGPIVAAARARGIPAFRLDAESLVQLGQGSRQRRVRTATTDRTGFIAEAVARDKQLTKNLLAQLGLPVPIGRIVTNEDDAWAAATEVGWPVVVKPRDADFGNGVSLRLRTREEVSAAYRRARQFSETVIVEQQLEGFPHRVLIVGEHVVGAVRREPAYVIGDGRHTVLELIEQLNRDPRRGPVDDKTTPWFPVEADANVQTALAHQGLDWLSVPAAGQEIDLRWQSCDWQGDCMYDATDDIHPDVAESLIDAVRLIGLDVAGVDLIATDLLRPLDEQRGGILEINAEPAILVHMRPVCQPSRPIPEAIVSHLFPRPDEAHIPIIALLSDTTTDDVSRWLSRWLQDRGDRVGRASRDGTWLGQRRVCAEPSDHAFRVRSLLLHPRVDAVVCQLSAESVRSEGLPFDRCTAAVLLSNASHKPHPACQGGSLDFALREIDGDLSRAETHEPLGQAQWGENQAEPLSAERLLARVGAARGFVVINADDPQLAKLVTELVDHALPISMDANNPHVVQARERGGRAACVRGETIVLSEGRHELLIVPNSAPDLVQLAATATAWGLGLAPESLCWSTGPSTSHPATSTRIDTRHARQRMTESYSPV
jgi:cyanophycin synthetase